MRILLCLFCMVAFPALAVVLESPLEDASQEARAQAIFKQVRCMVCDGESVADSDALFSREWRSIIREEVQAGKSDEEIIAKLHKKFGDKILMQPPLQSHAFLWLLPLVILITGGLGIREYIRSQNHSQTIQNR